MEGYRDDAASMKRLQEGWGTREDVKKFNQQKYGNKTDEERADIERRQREHYLPQGMDDFRKMDKCMKYANSIKDENPNLTEKQRDKKARIVSDFIDGLDSTGTAAITDSDKREKYIKSMTQGMSTAEADKAKKRYENLFIEAAKFQRANSKIK